MNQLYETTSMTILRDRRLEVLLWFILGFECLVVFLALRPWLAGDSYVYLFLARDLKLGQYGRIQYGVLAPEAARSPGYPVFLWLLQSIGLASAGIVAVQLALYLLSLGLLARTLRDWSRPVLPFLMLAALSPQAAGYSAQIMSEGLTTATFSAAFFFSTRPRLAVWSSIALGISLAVGTLTRPPLILLFLPSIVVIVSIHKFTRGTIKGIVLAMVVFACMLVPYSLYNWKHFRTFRPIPMAEPAVLWLATWDLSPQDFEDFRLGVVTDRNREFANQAALLNSVLGVPKNTPPYSPEFYENAETQIRASVLFRQAAVERIRAHPFAYARRSASALWQLWNNQVYPAAMRPLVPILASSSAALWVLAFPLGIYYAVRNRRLLLCSTLFALYLPALHMWLIAVARYTAPARPVYFLVASLSLMYLLRDLGFGAVEDPSKSSALTLRSS
jgi:hypothetical protein